MFLNNRSERVSPLVHSLSLAVCDDSVTYPVEIVQQRWLSIDKE
jgi:hypothetical protein